MHDESVLVEAIRLRLHGAAVKEIARQLGVSVGWASLNLSGIRPRLRSERRMLAARTDEMQADAKWSRLRYGNRRRLTPREVSVKQTAMAALRMATEDFTVLPPPNGRDYKYLDKLQQRFARQPGHADFGIIEAEHPKLLAHLVEWRNTRHGVTQDKSDTRFVQMAGAARDHVSKHLTPPSFASEDAHEVAAARWLGRWIANARGRGERRRNVARTHIVLEIGDIVDGLRSKLDAPRDTAVRAVQDGRWDTLFRELIATRATYEYEEEDEDEDDVCDD